MFRSCFFSTQFSGGKLFPPNGLLVDDWYHHWYLVPQIQPLAKASESLELGQQPSNGSSVFFDVFFSKQRKQILKPNIPSKEKGVMLRC